MPRPARLVALAAVVAASLAAAQVPARALPGAANEADLEIDVSGRTDAVRLPNDDLTLRYTVVVENTGPGVSWGALVTVRARNLPERAKLTARAVYGVLRCYTTGRDAARCRLRPRRAGDRAEVRVTVYLPGSGEPQHELEVAASVADSRASDPVKLSNSDSVRTRVDLPQADLRPTLAPINTVAPIGGGRTVYLLDEDGTGQVKLAIAIVNAGPNASARAFLDATPDRGVLAVTSGTLPCRPAAAGLTCSATALPGGEVARGEFTAYVSGAGVLTVRATVSNDPKLSRDPDMTNNTASVQVELRARR